MAHENLIYTRSVAGRKPALLKRDSMLAVTLFITAFLVVYFAPAVLARLFFLGLFAYAFYSKEYGVMAAFYLVLLMNPVNLFRDVDLPIFSLTGGLSLGIYDILGAILLIKALSMKRRFLFFKTILILAVLLAVYLMVSFFDGSEFSNVVRTLRVYFYLSSYFVFSAFLSEKRHNDMFIRIVFIFAVLGVLDQVFALVTKKYLLSFISAREYGLTPFILQDVDEYRSFPSGFLLVYFALVFIFCHPRFFKGKVTYGYWLVGLFSLSILISSTRQWLVNLVIIFTLTAVFTRSFKRTILYPLVTILVLTVILVNLGVFSSSYLQRGVLERYGTIGEVMAGDYTSIDTRVRDLKKIVKNASDNFLFGMGFRAKKDDMDNDLSGFLNAIIRFGILGAILFASIFIVAIHKLRRCYIYTRNQTVLTLVFVWIALLVQYLTVYDFLSFSIFGISLIMLLLAFTERKIRETLTVHRS